MPLIAGCGRQDEPGNTATVAPAASAKPAFDPSRGTAAITGKVLFEGKAPSPAPIKMTADAVCVALHKEPLYTEDLLADNGNLQNAFVYIKEGLEKYSFAPPSEPAVLSQLGCRYIPHVSGMMVDQKLKILNDDPTTHNVRTVCEHNSPFNIGQPMKGMEAIKSFENPEVMILFKCDVHKWMSAYIGVLPHPYFCVTGKDGAFSLKGLPAGDYLIEAWHEKLGIQDQKLTVGDHESKEIRFEFRATS